MDLGSDLLVQCSNISSFNNAVALVEEGFRFHPGFQVVVPNVTDNGSRFELIHQLREKEAANQEIVRSIGAPKTPTPDFPKTPEHTYDAVLRDLDRLLTLVSTSTFTWLNHSFLRILLRENHTGCPDLSRAGKLGIADAYRVMKRHCYK